MTLLLALFATYCIGFLVALITGFIYTEFDDETLPQQIAEIIVMSIAWPAYLFP